MEYMIVKAKKPLIKLRKSSTVLSSVNSKKALKPSAIKIFQPKQKLKFNQPSQPK